MRQLFQMKSVQKRLLFPTIISFTVATLVITFLVVKDADNAVEKVLSELRYNAVELVENDLDTHLNQAIQLNEIHKDMLSREFLHLEDVKERERYFSLAIKNYPDAVMTFIGLPDGQFYGARKNLDGTINVVRNNQKTYGNSEYYSINEMGEGTTLVQTFENYDPRKRPWYINTVEKKDINFSPIYSHFVFKEPTITASIPIYEEDTLIGVFGVDFLMTWLGETLSKLPIGEHGQIFIVDDQQQLVASTTGEDIFTVEDNQSKNILAKNSINSVTKEVIINSEVQISKESYSLSIQGEKYLIGVDHYTKNGIAWDIYTVLQRNDFLRSMNRTLVNALMIIMLLSILFIILIYHITKKIVTPIIKLNESAKKLSGGTYHEVLVKNRKDEVGELAQSFNHMGMKLSSLVNHLEDEVIARTNELEAKNQILQRMTYIDDLSQISNRRKFNEYIYPAVEGAIQSNQPIGLLMIDIDYFKKYNDLYGHIVGDDCIRMIGSVLKQIVTNNYDLAARYGGEEFVVVLNNTSFEEVKNTANKIHQMIEGLNIKHEASDWGIVTVSIGVVYGIVTSMQSATQVITLADDALYRAKDKGRNLIEYWNL
jgi:diguanylate cyclase (GGDEF)-like protein